MKVLLKSLILVVIISLHGLHGHSNVLASSSSLTASETVSPTISCPSGYVPFYKECVKSVVQTATADVVLQCHPGYTLTSDGVCATSVSSYTPEQSQGHVANVPNCPPAYHYAGDTCWPVSTNPVIMSLARQSHASPFCPTGYYFDGIACVAKEYKVPAMSSCPVGFTWDSSGQCMKRTTTVDVVAGNIVCPSGYTMIENSCRRAITSGNIITHPRPAEKVNGQRSVLIEIERNQMINIGNDLNVPVNITNLNQKTVFIGVDGKEIMVNKPKVDAPETKDGVPSAEGENCCEVVSPRMCKRRPNNDWYCFHRRTEKCGRICTAPVVYIRPTNARKLSSTLLQSQGTIERR